MWLFLQWGDQRLEQQKETLAQQASTTLADMFIFLDPQKMFRYNVLAMVVLPVLVAVHRQPAVHPRHAGRRLRAAQVLRQPSARAAPEDTGKTAAGRAADDYRRHVLAGASLNVAVES